MPFFRPQEPLKRNPSRRGDGGPSIARNKLPFFAKHEGLRQASPGKPPVGKVFTPNERNGITTPVKDPFTDFHSPITPSARPPDLISRTRGS